MEEPDASISLLLWKCAREAARFNVPRKTGNIKLQILSLKINWEKAVAEQIKRKGLG